MPPKTAPAATPRWQSIATVLLILHLFCLAIGIAVSAGGGSSIVGQSLRGIPLTRPYLQLLMMDMAYDFRLAGVEENDGVHRLQLHRGGAVAEAAPVGTLPDDATTGIRRRRYEHLAYFISFFDDLFKENSDLRTQLPLAVAQRWVRQLDLPNDPYVLKCFRVPSKRLPKAVAADVSYAYVMREGGLTQETVEKPPPPPVNIFMVWDSEEARYQGSREAPAGQAAEVVRPPASTNSNPAPGQ